MLRLGLIGFSNRKTQCQSPKPQKPDARNSLLGPAAAVAADYYSSKRERTRNSTADKCLQIVRCIPRVVLCHHHYHHHQEFRAQSTFSHSTPIVGHLMWAAYLLRYAVVILRFE